MSVTPNRGLPNSQTAKSVEKRKVGTHLLEGHDPRGVFLDAELRRDAPERFESQGAAQRRAIPKRPKTKVTGGSALISKTGPAKTEGLPVDTRSPK